MTDPAPPPADLALLAEVAALGQQVSWSQLRRWRKAGLAPSPDRPGAGRGKGRPSIGYPKGTAKVVTKIAEVLQAGFSIHEAALARRFHGGAW